MNIIIKNYLSSKNAIKIFDDSKLVWYCTHVTLYFMRKIIFSILVSSVFIGTTFAATIACPSGSGCDSCFGFTLDSTNSTYNVFIPRAGENEFIDTGASSIFAETFQ